MLEIGLRVRLCPKFLNRELSTPQEGVFNRQRFQDTPIRGVQALLSTD